MNLSVILIALRTCGKAFTCFKGQFVVWRREGIRKEVGEISCCNSPGKRGRYSAWDHLSRETFVNFVQSSCVPDPFRFMEFVLLPFFLTLIRV